MQSEIEYADEFVPIADRIYDEHIENLKKNIDLKK